jgi:hypothetical protein
MTNAEVASVYETSRPLALSVLRARGIPAETAEDAIQEAAAYFLVRAASYARVTPSLFVQVCVQRGLNGVRPEGQRGSRPREVSVGSSLDLAALSGDTDDALDGSD